MVADSMTSVETDEFPSMELFRDRINFALERAKLSQSELARRIGTTPQNVQNMTTREKPVYRGTRLLELAEALRVPAGWLACNDKGAVPASRIKQSENKATPVLDTADLTPLQVAGLEALASLMRSGDFTNEEVIDLLGDLKPRLARLKQRR
jgi:transcriptional regulator with XRE-family HTH domain